MLLDYILASEVGEKINHSSTKKRMLEKLDACNLLKSKADMIRPFTSKFNSESKLILKISEIFYFHIFLSPNFLS